jgi:hypothetical protein
MKSLQIIQKKRRRITYLRNIFKMESAKAGKLEKQLNKTITFVRYANVVCRIRAIFIQVATT